MWYYIVIRYVGMLIWKWWVIRILISHRIFINVGMYLLILIYRCAHIFFFFVVSTNNTFCVGGVQKIRQLSIEQPYSVPLHFRKTWRSYSDDKCVYSMYINCTSTYVFKHSMQKNYKTFMYLYYRIFNFLR